MDPSTCQIVEDSKIWAWHLSSSEAGSGKTLLVNKKLKNLGDSFVLANIDFNFSDSAETTQRALEKHLIR